MNLNSNRYLLPWLIAITLLLHSRQATAQQATAFTYQGQLRDGGTNANGTYTMTFKLYNAASGGGQIGTAITDSPTLANGLFTVNLDFGAAAFNGSARWLDIVVAGDTLTPRVQVLPAPYALFSAVAATVTNGAIMNAQLAAGSVTNANLTANAVATANVQNNAVTTAKIADGNVTDAKIADGNVTDAKIVSVSGSKVSGAVASATFATSAGSATLANSVAANSIVTTSLLEGAVTGAKIAGGQVVNSLNGLADAVTLSAGQNVTLTQSGNDIRISALLTNSTVIGSWTIDSGTISAPGGPTLSGALRFRSGGVTRLGLDVNGLGSVSYTGFTVVGDVNASGTIRADTSVYSQGDITANGQMFASAFNQTSDRRSKENFEFIDGKDVLARVVSLPISSWNFKTEGNTRHIGPMAQDFYTAFNVGMDNMHIATVDEGGVALAAIQGLNEKLKEKEAKIEAMEKRLADLEELIQWSMHK